MTSPAEPHDTSMKPLFPVLVLAAVLFFANTWGYDLWPADEPRFGEVAREMMASGDYLAPHVNGMPYKEKPPLLFWSICAASIPFGDVTEFSARAPSALAALLTLAFTYLLARRLYGARVAFWAGLILATSQLFWFEARSVRTDMILTATMTGALLAFQRWRDAPSLPRLIAFYAAIAAGMFAKGPPALVFPLLLIVTFYWRRPQERRRTHWVAGLLGATALILVWFIPARMSLPAEEAAPAAGVGVEAFRMTIGRFLFGVSKARAPWYYLFELPAGLFPWALLLPWTLPWIWKRRHEDERMRLLMKWTLPAFIFFSISIGKRSVYLLPIYPTIAILQARAVLDLIGGDARRWRTRTAIVWGALLILLGAAVFAIPYTEYAYLWSTRFVFLGGSTLAMGVFAIARALRTQGRSLPADMAAGFTALTLLIVTVVFPALNPYKGASSICRPLRQLSESGTEYRLYTLGFSREEYIFYTKHFHTPFLTDLLPVTLAHEIGRIDMIKKQRKLRKAIAKSVEDIPIASIAAPTDAELSVLRTAAHDVIEETGVGAELARAFEAALTETVEQFATQFDTPTPAFAFVQREDWKWLLPLMPPEVDYTILADRHVGSRDILLLANAAGASLTASIAENPPAAN
ncbi:MAG: phospholipid carrier-dependent glycosyltransferase [Nitrospiraceae bacterium]|nr:phospholipid carrier-dependent glycosyltransferase [Nitrospiraceae bacterium]